MSDLYQRLASTSAYSGGNAAYIEDLYERFLEDPGSVPEHWSDWFRQVADDARPDTAHGPVRAHFARLAREKPVARASSSSQLSPDAAELQASVLRLINAYRVRGHQVAQLDPLQQEPKTADFPDLNPEYYRLTRHDLQRVFNTGSLYAPQRMKLADIIDLLREVYCRSVGSEYMHITNTREKRWIQKRLEGYRARPELSKQERLWLQTLLTAAEGIERYLHTKYVGQKRFSLEGAESLIPLLDELIQRCGRQSVREVVIGMAHRGRLNVLTNILGKPPAEIFDAFEGKFAIQRPLHSGDVKYHQGFSTDVETPGGLLHVALGFNPSHLEIIDPVIEGSVRARQQRHNDREGNLVIPVLIHGDSAFAGQGVVMETLNLSQTRGYATGGTVHIIVNNQIGFTTSNPLDTRSTHYCTDVAKMVQAPIFHVNGDDPEAVIFVTRLALDFRMSFHKDVVIDLVCYRRHGHNEADEPAVTQPVMYNKIRQHPTTRSIYADRLIESGLLTPEQAQDMVTHYRDSIEQGRVIARPIACPLNRPFQADWSPFRNIDWTHFADTRVAMEKLQSLALELLELPTGFQLHPQVARIMEARRKMATGNQLADWGFAENLCYATLLEQGVPVRLSGQDAARGTFFHRHAVLHHSDTGEAYTPLHHVAEQQANFLIIDSLLSEEAVLAYEYGYATAEPRGLTLWEAQFGDFANGAQVVIDQFISSAHAKWGLYCGLVLMLPHGYEGQGPEHSSARLERFMQLCANQNMQVAVPTTPAQIFHLLRRQILRPYRKPLIVFTPKSLLRHKLATSRLADMADGHFQTLIDEIDPLERERIKRLILCSGKVYYDLLEARRARGVNDVAIVRVEQLYPFPKEDFARLMEQYSGLDSLAWCQEEPQNQGAWDQIKHRFSPLLGETPFFYVGRPTCSAPATGFHTLHVQQQKQLVDDALNGTIRPQMNRHLRS